MSQVATRLKSKVTDINQSEDNRSDDEIESEASKPVLRSSNEQQSNSNNFSTPSNASISSNLNNSLYQVMQNFHLMNTKELENLSNTKEIDSNTEQVDPNTKQVDPNTEQVDPNTEQVDPSTEQVDSDISSSAKSIEDLSTIVDEIVDLIFKLKTKGVGVKVSNQQIT